MYCKMCNIFKARNTYVCLLDWCLYRVFYSDGCEFNFSFMYYEKCSTISKSWNMPVKLVWQIVLGPSFKRLPMSLIFYLPVVCDSKKISADVKMWSFNSNFKYFSSSHFFLDFGLHYFNNYTKKFDSNFEKKDKI